jgi:hypothetical protein
VEIGRRRGRPDRRRNGGDRPAAREDDNVGVSQRGADELDRRRRAGNRSVAQRKVNGDGRIKWIG